MLRLVRALLPSLRSALRTRTDLALENLALRQQLAALRQQVKRPRVRFADRLFWAMAASLLGTVAGSPDPRSTRDGHPLASTRLQEVLDLEVASSRPRPSR